MNQKEKFKIDFIGIGAGRSGTTWISKCLAEHPQICFSNPKETEFFNREINIFIEPNIFSHEDKCFSKYDKDGMEGLVKYFSHCENGQIKGEWSVKYLHEPLVAEKIKKEFPNIKILACLRNPIDRAYSQFYFAKYIQGFEKCCKTFLEAFKKHPLFYKYNSLYYEQLKKYFEIFPRENILVLIYEDIKNDPQKFIQNIYKFLEVDESFIPPSLNKKVNNVILPAHPHLIRLYSFISAELRKAGLDPLIKILKKTKFKKAIDSVRAKKVFKKPLINIKTKQYLQNIFNEDIKNLKKLIERDLSIWQ